MTIRPAVQLLAEYIPFLHNFLTPYADNTYGLFSDLISSTVSALLAQYIIDRWKLFKK